MDFAIVLLLILQQITVNHAYIPTAKIPKPAKVRSANVNRPAEFRGTVAQILRDNDYFSGTTGQDENIQYIQGLKLLKPLTADANLSVFFNVDFEENAWKGGGFNICDKPAETFDGTMLKVMQYFFGVGDEDCPINELNAEESLRKVELSSTSLPEEEAEKFDPQEITFSIYAMNDNHKAVLVVKGTGTW